MRKRDTSWRTRELASEYDSDGEFQSVCKAQEIYGSRCLQKAYAWVKRGNENEPGNLPAIKAYYEAMESTDPYGVIVRRYKERNAHKRSGGDA